MKVSSMIGWFGFFWLVTAIVTAVTVEGRREDVSLRDIVLSTLWSFPITLTLWGLVQAL